jgi:hypothetical protein
MFLGRPHLEQAQLRLRRRSNFVRPYIWRLIILMIILMRSTVRSTVPELRASVRPLVTAARCPRRTSWA